MLKHGTAQTARILESSHHIRKTIIYFVTHLYVVRTDCTVRTNPHVYHFSLCS